MTNKKNSKYFLLFFLVSIFGCVTPHREFNVAQDKKCESLTNTIATLDFQNTESYSWNEWEKREFSKFIKEVTCLNTQENNIQKGLKITFKKNDTSPALTTFEAVTGVISVVTLFIFPSQREKSETIEMEVQNLDNGRIQKFESGYSYAIFTHILSLAVVPLGNGVADYDKKIFTELIMKARSEGYKL